MDRHSQITESIFISDWHGSVDVKQLQDNKIKYILCLNYENKKTEKDMDMYSLMGIKHKYIKIQDIPSESIVLHFESIINFIRNEHRGNILVHCSAGISRSTTAVIAYLCNKLYMSHSYPNTHIMPKIIAHVKKRRPYCNPNHGFLKQLFEYEMFLKKKLGRRS